MATKKKRVLIVDDSAFVRNILSDLLNKDGRFEVLATCKNGKEGLEKAIELDPDVVSTDIEMPIMNGLQMIEALMKVKSIPIVVISSLTKAGAKETIAALDLGAFDFTMKPSNLFGNDADEIYKSYVNKVYTAAVYKRKYHPPISSLTKRPPRKVSSSQVLHQVPAKKLVAIGTSTGGPKALQEVLPYITGSVEAGIVIVQHMPPKFTKSLAERLNQLSDVEVKEAENGEIIMQGMAYIAPGDRHLVVDEKRGKYFIRLDDGPKKGPHKPSVDVMMSSLARLQMRELVAVIMTGMGSDGLEGMSELKQKKETFIIAQDEKSCVVYGMPRAVVEAGIANRVVPLREIAKAVEKQLEVF